MLVAIKYLTNILDEMPLTVRKRNPQFLLI